MQIKLCINDSWNILVAKTLIAGHKVRWDYFANYVNQRNNFV